MATYPFFSVIVPVYNRKHHLRQLLDCLNEQDYPGSCYEIIVVDDGSNDDLPVLLTGLRAKCKFTLLHQQHLGPGAARNLGAQAAQGGFLAFTDSDCRPDSAWLTALAMQYAHTDAPEITAIGGLIQNIEGGHWLNNFQAHRGVDHIANQEISPLYLDTANAAFPRFSFLGMGGFNQEYTRSEDVDLGFRWRRAGYHLYTTPNARVWHVGTRSLAAYLKRAYGIGYAKRCLAIRYPDVFYPMPTAGLLLAIRNWLERNIQPHNRAAHAPVSTTACLPRLLYNLAQLIAWEKDFWWNTLPQQARRYRQQKRSIPHTGAYLFLEGICHLAYMAGVASSFIHEPYHPASQVE